LRFDESGSPGLILAGMDRRPLSSKVQVKVPQNPNKESLPSQNFPFYPTIWE